MVTLKKQVAKCIVPACENYTGMPGNKFFFRVPSTSHKTFGKWTRFLHLSGNRTEMICNDHFCKTDFVSHSRLKLKNRAVPSEYLLKNKPIVQLGGICCVTGCRTKTRKSMEPFPKKNPALQCWKDVLKIDEFLCTTSLMICHRHFSKSSFKKVISMYLKPNAIPSKKVVPLVRIPRRHFLAGKRPKHLLDHNYNKYEECSRSNRICYVAGCRSKTTANITLHSFPQRSDSRFNIWIDLLRCKIMPTKNSKVCSQHFDKTCYVPGGKHLKTNAIPTLNLRYKTNQAKKLITSSSNESFEYTAAPNNGINPYSIDASRSSMNLENFKELDETANNTNHINDEKYEAKVSQSNTNRDEICNECVGVSNTHNSMHPTLSDTRKTASNQTKNFKCESLTMNNKSTSTDRVGCSNCLLSDFLRTDKEVNTWTGLPSLALLEEICLAARKLEIKGVHRKFAMHTTDRVILTLAKLKQNISFEALECLFQLTGVTAAKYFSHMIPIISSILRKFIHWPTKEEIKENVPLCFREHFPNVTIILDCTEIAVASLKCLNCRIASYSNYKCRRTIKFLVGVTPAGLISFVSQAYSGKASDKFIFNSERLIDRLEPHVDEIMVDKGISIEAECSSKCIKLHIPPFMRGERLTPLEASRNEAIARARIHVERVIQRIKVFSILSDTITANVLGHIDDIMQIACGIVNLCPPVLKDDKF